MKNNKYCISSSYAAHNIETPICPKVITPRNYNECGLCPLVQAIIGADKELLAPKYYVYGHYLNGELFYIGKGTNNRYSQKSNRGTAYTEFINNNPGAIEHRILVNNLISDNAIALEAFLIDLYIKQGVKLINTHVANLSYEEYKQKYKDQCQKGIKSALARGVQFGKPSKLTHDQISDIRSKSLTQKQYSDLYSISISYVAKIQANKHHE